MAETKKGRSAAYDAAIARLGVLTHTARRGEASPKDLAEDLGLPIGNVAYHVRALAAGGLLELRRTAKVRGAKQSFYGVTSLSVAYAAAHLAAATAAANSLTNVTEVAHA